MMEEEKIFFSFLQGVYARRASTLAAIKLVLIHFFLKKEEDFSRA